MQLTQGQQVVVEGASGDRERFNGRTGKIVGVQPRLDQDDEPFALVRLDGGGNTWITGHRYRVFLEHEVKQAG